MEEKEVQKIIAERAFRHGLLVGAKEYADVVFQTVDDPAVLEKLLIDFKVLGIKLAKANVEVDVVDLREEQEEEKDAEKETVVVKAMSGMICPKCKAIIATNCNFCSNCGSDNRNKRG